MPANYRVFLPLFVRYRTERLEPQSGVPAPDTERAKAA
jgi:hypothetical protein